MDFGFRRLKLSNKLLLLVAIPIFLSLSVLVYFLRDSQTVAAHIRLVAIVLVLLVAYGLFAIFFIRNLLSQFCLSNRCLLYKDWPTYA